jgi:aminoglycoside/choline kinase family phosphotransferase
MTSTDLRIAALEDWLRNTVRWPLERLASASADASFRRYFRVWSAAGATRIVMDAPPDKEDIRPYLEVSAMLSAAGAHVPAVEALSSAHGFILMEDLGSTHMLAGLNAGGDADALYGAALAALADLQARGAANARALPPYDHAVLMREMQLLPDWFCARHLQLTLNAEVRALLATTMEFLAAAALAQPQVLVHRDYHSRNLMITTVRSPGIIDFQDALYGPITYDAVSLLKDCYIEWPRARVAGWLAAYRRQIMACGLDAGASDTEFLRWFDLMGLQRHLKVLGIFARLWYRDGKRGYLADLPLTLHYVRTAAALHPQLGAFSAWLNAEIVPRLAAANQRELA